MNTPTESPTLPLVNEFFETLISPEQGHRYAELAAAELTFSPTFSINLSDLSSEEFKDDYLSGLDEVFGDEWPDKHVFGFILDSEHPDYELSKHLDGVELDKSIFWLPPTPERSISDEDFDMFYADSSEDTFKSLNELSTENTRSIYNQHFHKQSLLTRSKPIRRTRRKKSPARMKEGLRS